MLCQGIYGLGRRNKLGEIAVIKYLSRIRDSVPVPGQALYRWRVVAKQRNGPTCIVKLAFYTGLTRFKDYMLVSTHKRLKNRAN